MTSKIHAIIKKSKHVVTSKLQKLHERFKFDGGDNAKDNYTREAFVRIRNKTKLYCLESIMFQKPKPRRDGKKGRRKPEKRQVEQWLAGTVTASIVAVVVKNDRSKYYYISFTMRSLISR